MWVLVHVLAALLLIRLGKAVKDRLSLWSAVTYVGDLDEAPSFSLCQPWLLQPSGK